MSHIVKLKTKINDVNALIKALKRMGVSEDRIKYYPDPVKVNAYHREESFYANVVVTRKESIFSDIGWRFTSDGCESYIDDMYYNKEWQNKLHMYYNVEKCKTEFEKRNIRFIEEEKDGKVLIRAQLNNNGGNRWQS